MSTIICVNFRYLSTSRTADAKASVCTVEQDVIDGFWAAHRALAAFYEADMAKLQDQVERPVDM